MKALYLLILVCFISTHGLGQHRPTGRTFRQKQADSNDPAAQRFGERRRNAILQPSNQRLNEGRHVAVGVMGLRDSSHYTFSFEEAEERNRLAAIRANILTPFRITMDVDTFSRYALTNSAKLYTVNVYEELELGGQLYSDPHQGVFSHPNFERVSRGRVLDAFVSGTPILGINRGELKYICGFCEGRKLVPNGFHVETTGIRKPVYTQCPYCHGVGYRFASVNVLYSIELTPIELASD